VRGNPLGGALSLLGDVLRECGSLRAQLVSVKVLLDLLLESHGFS